MLGKNSIQWITLICQNCQVSFEVNPFRKDIAKYCSKHCMNEFRAKDLKTYAEINQERNSPKYKDWRKKVCSRDNWKCKISNSGCKGRLEVHHILSFSKFAELKYEVNNGITLCHFHHPRKRVEEEKLSPYFQKLVAEMN